MKLRFTRFVTLHCLYWFVHGTGTVNFRLCRSPSHILNNIKISDCWINRCVHHRASVFDFFLRSPLCLCLRLLRSPLCLCLRLFFCDSWVFLMKKWLATAKPDNRGESLRALQEVSKQRITTVADQYFTNLWRVGGSQGRGAPSIEYRDRQKDKAGCVKTFVENPERVKPWYLSSSCEASTQTCPVKCLGSFNSTDRAPLPELIPVTVDPGNN
jgi:hypothetical protein